MGLFDAIGDAASSIGHAVSSAVSDTADAIGHAASDVGHAVAGAADDVAHAAGSAIHDTFEVIKGGADWTLGAVDTVAHAADDAASEVGGFFKKTTKYVGGLISNAAEGVWGGVKDFASGVAGAAENFFGGFAQGIVGFADNLAHGRIADAFGAAFQGLDKALIQAPQRLWNGMLDGVQGVLDGASQLLPGVLGDAARQVIDRGADIVRTAGNTLFEAGRDVFHMVTDTAVNFANDMYKVGDDLVHGRIGDAAKHFGGAFVHAGSSIVGGFFDIGMRTFQGVASIAQTATGLEPPARKLSAEEKDMLKKVYGDTIDYDSIRIKVGGALNNAMAPHTVGNTIYMPLSTYRNGDGVDRGALYQPKKDAMGNVVNGPDGKPVMELTPYGQTLIHEAGHVWQSENGGGKYIHESLWGQASEMVQGNKRDEDYKWTQDVPGTPFADLNPEQQCKFIEQVLGPALTLPGNEDDNLKAALRKAGVKEADLDACVAYAKAALDDIHNRRGMA